MEKKGQNPIKKFLGARGVGQVVTVFFGLIALCIVFYIMNPNFLGPRNIPNLLRQIAPFIIIGIGQGYVLITANIDLSIGSVVGMTCMIIATMICKGSHPIPAILVAFAAALATGVVNGSLVAKFKLPPFVATLGTQTICRGVAQLVNNNMNTVMRTLTSVSIIMMLPTLISSFFGMNLINGLENYRFGFIVAIIISVIISALSWIILRHKRLL